MASLTRVIFSASSSGISIPNSSSNAMTSSTVSSESAPRSSTNEASAVTSSSSTPSGSTMMLFTLSATAIWPPLHVHAAVDGKDLTCNIRRLIRGKKTNCRGDIGRGAESPERNLRRPVVLRLLGDRLGHVRGDQARGDDVDRDVARGDLARHGFA